MEMMLVVDVSNSMLAEDFEPNRLERTKYAINKLFDGLRQDRVGLIVFAGEPKVQLPITSDYRMAKAFAKRIDPSLVSVQGTAIGKALSQALLSFSGETEETHSPGHHPGDRRREPRGRRPGGGQTRRGDGHTHLHHRHRHAEGAPIQIGGEFIKDEKGDMVVSKLDEKMLSEVAQITAAPMCVRPSVDRPRRDRKEHQRNGTNRVVDDAFRGVQRAVPIPAHRGARAAAG